MKRALIILSLLLGSCAAIKKMSERQIKYEMPFSHAKHTTPWAEQSIQCTDCHRYTRKSGGETLVMISDSKWQSKPEDIKMRDGNDSLSNNRMKSLKEQCHPCHVEAQGKNLTTPFSRSCYLCHKPTDRSFIPASHRANWKFTHQLAASFRSSECYLCHEVRECSDCHLMRTPKFGRNHPEGYQFFHSIDARFNASTCDSCHEPSYCVRCHSPK
jgi:hypothetical protein